MKLKNPKIDKLESLENFKLSVEHKSSIIGMGTEICTQRCSNQYDCANDDGSQDYGTDAEFDNC